MVTKLSVLKSLNLGQRVAEDELSDLAKYFVETSQWTDMLAGTKDVVYGPKGTGKSALYGLLNTQEEALRTRNVFLASAENVRGATVFKGLISSPPPTESAFIFLWKLYCLVIAGKALQERGIKNASSTALVSALQSAKLLVPEASISSVFRSVQDYFKGLISRDVSAVEYGLSIDPATGMPTATRKVEFRQSGTQAYDDVPVDSLLEIADRGFKQADKSLWILFDRLDVAFVDSPDLERNALRALFRTYNDLRALGNISLKIFVRDDIWRRISTGGFAEASHIIRTTNITWTDQGLLNLVVLRLLNSTALLAYLGLDAEAVRADFNEQKKLILRILPPKVDTGKNPDTFEWMVTRVKDGLGITAPRELIHLMEWIRELQIKRLERREPEPPDDQLFDRAVFKEALKEVSKVRYAQTLAAEYPDLKSFMDKLESQKSDQTVSSLAAIWQLDSTAAVDTAERLVGIGFFEKRERKGVTSYWIPFLYRGALKVVQGPAGQRQR
jgi:hypothetical protein